MATIAETFTQALQYHQSGDWLRAEQCYRQVCQVDPHHADAHHLLGLLAYQQGRYDQAAVSFREAVIQNSSAADYRNNLGLALNALGRLDEAIASFQEALKLQPDMAEAHNNIANSLLSQRRLPEATLHYRQAVQLRPDYAQAHCGLGIALASAGEVVQAEHHYREAIRFNPHLAEFHNNLANVLQLQGRAGESIAHCQEALRLLPDFAEAHVNLGNAWLLQEEWANAERCFREALRFHPGYAEAYNGLGFVAEKQNRIDEARGYYQQAVRCRPDFVEAYNNLGNCCALQNKLDEAVAHYQQALRLDPLLVSAWNNLGCAHSRQERLEEAIAAFEQVIRIRPNFAAAHSNLAEALRHLGRLDAALAACLEATRQRPNYVPTNITLAFILHASGKTKEARAGLQDLLQRLPDCAEAHSALGLLLMENHEFEQALSHYEQAVTYKPGLAEAHANMASLLAQMGRLTESETHFQVALRLLPSDALRVKEATALPAIYQSVEEMFACRRRLTQKVQQLCDDGVKVDLTNELAVPAFFLSYQGANDRDLLRQIASLYAEPKEFNHRPKSRLNRAADKINVGLISSCFRSHSVGHWMRGLVANLSRELFTVTVLAIGSHDDVIARQFKQHADRYLEVPVPLKAARRFIADQHVDILIYPDIGMDPLTYTLAFSRLAPIQCTTVGHPSTSGIDAIDYFISSEDLETEEATSHYTETLIRHQALPIYFYRTQRRPELKRREDFGLAQGEHVYACLQYLFKLHPEFDGILGAILRSDPKGVLLLSLGKVPAWEAPLRKRFEVTLPDVINRIRFLPHQDYPSYLDLLAAVDVQLDPIHFGGGMTSYEAFAEGLPIVTCPSKLLRGRFTYALYKQMQILDCVASDAQQYINIAIRLGTDPAFREHIRRRILAANSILYDNSAGIREWERFLHQAALNSNS